MPDVSIIIPTLNEAENIGGLLIAIDGQMRATGLRGEIIVVDDGSTDGTPGCVRAFTGETPVRLVERARDGGLSGAVLAGAKAAAHDIVVVMDADHSHPVDAIHLLARPIMQGTHDVAIGSRYVSGGRTVGWPWRRRLMSRIATWMASPLVDARDPMSGFFATRRASLLGIDPRACGFKICLEVLVASGGRVTEVPIVFSERARGASKVGVMVIRDLLLRLVALAGGRAQASSAWRFLVVGLLGMGVDSAAFLAMRCAGFRLSSAHVAGFALATLFNYVLNSRWAFEADLGWRRYARFMIVCLLALFLRGAALALGIAWGLPEGVALIMAIVAAAGVNFVGMAFYVFPGDARPGARWPVAAVGVAVYMLALRLSYGGLLDLIPEEAYYWNYAQHLDIGYLDHPPLLAWAIAATSTLFGNNEFAIRLVAFGMWMVAAAFMFRFARNMHGRQAAWGTLLLMAVLPYFAGTGFLAMPEAPLIACWAAALFFLERALRGGHAKAWYGVGMAVGLGMLSKYTIALLGLGIVAHLAAAPESRRWLRRPQPYLGAILALLIFLPVLIWNARHDWISFRFQGIDRWKGATMFMGHDLALSIVALLSPVVVLALVGLAAKSWMEWRSQAGAPNPWRSFACVFTLAPLSVFVVYACFHRPRMNWTGPVWLAALPAVAAHLTTAAGAIEPRALRWFRAASGPMVALLMLLYGAGLHYLTLGFPGVAYPKNAIRLIGWRDLGRKVEAVEEDLERASGHEPLIVGMGGVYMVASELAFYHPEQTDRGMVLGNEADETAGGNLFGHQGLMYSLWFPASEQAGRDVVLVSRNRGDLEEKRVLSMAVDCGPIIELPVHARDGQLVGSYFCRVLHSYLGPRQTKAGHVTLLPERGHAPASMG